MEETYENMVARNFKNSGDWAVDVMHATVGIMGEVAELFDAQGKENFLEECGDLEFYFQALNQQFKEAGEELSQGEWENLPETFPNSHLSMVLTFTIKAGNLLDLAKKQWIYNKEPDIKGMKAEVRQLIAMLNFLYTISSTSRAEVRQLNMDKLNKRYPNKAGYSDQAAQARADKPAGE